MTNYGTTDLPEAPVSINTNLKSEKGFEYQITLRGSNYKKLLIGIEEIEKDFEEAGLKPMPKYQSRGFTKKETEYVDNKFCPADNGKLRVVHAKDGKTWWACDNGKYDYMTKTTIGCKFITAPENYEKKVAEYEAMNIDL
jgi:hypothetical protein